MSFKLTILGCNSAKPTSSRFTTAQVLQKGHKNYIIDCGEGIQMRLKEFNVKKSRIHQIFISHLHGDHFFGLPGLLTSLNLSGRTEKLTIYGPVGLNKFVTTLTEIGSFYLNFELIIHELQSSHFAKIFEDENFEVFSFPLKHRIPTTGFLFKERPAPFNLISSHIEKYKLTIVEIKMLKAGKDVKRSDGTLLKSVDHTKTAEKIKSYAFCSDTIYDEELLPYIKGADLLYHEATYMDDLAEKARERGHSTAKEAATIALKANVGKLVLGHYSSRYKDVSLFEKEARALFPKAELASDGREFLV